MRAAAAAVVMIAAMGVAGCSSSDASRAETSVDHAASEAASSTPSTIKDGLLYAAIKARLTAVDIDNATRISVAVHDGTVRLSGVVPTAAARSTDAAAVAKIRGVTHVDDTLVVGKPGPGAKERVADAALSAAVGASIAAQAGVNVTGIGVHANNGNVVLTGHVPSAAIRSTMVAAAQKTHGVRNVVDRIAVK